MLKGLTFDDVLLRPQRGVLESRNEADASTEIAGRILDIPILSAPMPSVTTPELARSLAMMGGLGVLHRFCSIEEQVDAWEKSDCNPAVAIGIHDGFDRTESLLKAGATTFVLDVAHADSIPVTRFLSEWDNRWGGRMGGPQLIAGNVATEWGANRVYQSGVNTVKVGIGPGSVCTTRQVTGFGVPQLEAIEVCAAEGVEVIADGGIRNSGDIVKALAAGADAVMIGSLFANSIEANNDGVHYGCASKRVNGHHAPEGMEKQIETEPVPLREIVKNLVWGIKSGISYGGGTTIYDLQSNAEWIKLTDAGRRESKLV